jgi:hypothetical protein
MLNRSISKLGNNVIFNNTTSDHHKFLQQHPYNQLIMNSFGGIGSSKATIKPSLLEWEGATEYVNNNAPDTVPDIAEHSNRLENSGSIIAHDNCIPNKKYENVLDYPHKKSVTKRFFDFFCCCFKVKENQNPLLSSPTIIDDNTAEVEKIAV